VYEKKNTKMVFEDENLLRTADEELLMMEEDSQEDFLNKDLNYGNTLTDSQS
jgi:hypothetical protein